MHILSIDWDYFFFQEKSPHWEILPLILSNKPKLILGDQHEEILQYINPNDHITNLDAHHDTGYTPYDKEINCGNWAKNLENYQLYYPNFRQIKPETFKPKIPFKYGYPPKQDYNILFACKSLEFIPKQFHYLWDNFTEQLTTITQ